MAPNTDFAKYMQDNKANLNMEALKTADLWMLQKEYLDTWSISKNYYTQPTTPTPAPAPVQTPVTWAWSIPQTTPNITPTPKTTWTTPPTINETVWATVETPKWQSQIDKALETKTVAEVRDMLKSWVTNWTITDKDFKATDRYLYSKLQNKDSDVEAIKQEKLKMELDPNTLFNSIRTGQTVREEIKNTPEYKKQQQRANNLSRFENMSAQDLSFQLRDWWLYIWTETYNDLKQINPALVKQAEQLNSLNSALSTKKTTVEDTLVNISNSILKNLTWDVTDFKSRLSQNPEVNKLNESLASQKLELDKIKEDMDYREDDLYKQLSWTWATRWYIQAKASKMNRDAIREYNAKLNEYNTTAGQLQTITENIKYEIWLEEQKKTKELQALQFAYWVASDELWYQRWLEAEQRQRAYQTEDRQTDYNYKYWDINSTDENVKNIAIERAVNSMYENYPIPWMESQSIKVQKIKNLMAQWKTGAEAIKQVEDEIRNSQRYKDYLANEKAKITPQISETKYWFNNVWNGTIAITDPKTWNVTFASVNSWTTNNRPDRNNNPWNIKAWDVWYWVDDQNHTIFWNATDWYNALVKDITAKLTWNTRTWLTPNSTLADLWKVYAEDPKWTDNLVSIAKKGGYNISKTTKLSELSADKLAPFIAKAEWFTWSVNTSTQQNQYNDEIKNWWDNIINNIWWAKITSIKDDNLRNQVSSYIAEKTKKQPNQNIATIYSLLNVLKELEAHPWLEWSIWLWTKWIFPATESAWFMAKLTQLEWKQFLEWIQQMKWMWALSNAEWLKVSSAASSLLNTKQKETDWKKELSNIKSILEWKITATEKDTWINFDIYW
jgi:uncharacterized protein YoaH (UPF0181 family)